MSTKMQAAPVPLGDRAKLFTALRGGVMFPNRFTAKQVEGIDTLLDVWEQYYFDDAMDLLAYNLATAFHETAGTMQPIKERGPVSYFDKYEPGTKLGKVLGNTTKGDGYRFRGEGHVQNTGRRNAIVAGMRLNDVFNLGVDLVKNPELRGDPFISAHSLFLGNREGWWTGKDLLDYLDGVDESEAEDLREFINARRVVNGTDKAEKIGRYALEWVAALEAAGYKPRRLSSAPAPAPTLAPVPVPPAVAPGGPAVAAPPVLAALGVSIAAVAGLLGGVPCKWFGAFCGG